MKADQSADEDDNLRVLTEEQATCFMQQYGRSSTKDKTPERSPAGDAPFQYIEKLDEDTRIDTRHATYLGYGRSKMGLQGGYYYNDYYFQGQTGTFFKVRKKVKLYPYTPSFVRAWYDDLGGDDTGTALVLMLGLIVPPLALLLAPMITLLVWKKSAGSSGHVFDSETDFLETLNSNNHEHVVASTTIPADGQPVGPMPGGAELVHHEDSGAYLELEEGTCREVHFEDPLENGLKVEGANAEAIGHSLDDTEPL